MSLVKPSDKDQVAVKMAGGRCGSLKEVEAMLEAMKIENDWSIKELKNAVSKKGICLRNGKEYGPKLPYVLKKNPAMAVSISQVKQFPLAKKCLVTLPE